jgi:hypothetical protein
VNGVRGRGSSARREAGSLEHELPTEAVPDWMRLLPPYATRPEPPVRSDLKKPIAARIGEEVNPDTGKYEPAVVDEEGYEWVVPAHTTRPERPFADAVGYNRDEHRLRIIFHNVSPASHGTGMWAYENVSATDWRQLRLRASTGRYMIGHIFSKPNHYEEFRGPW